MSSTTALVLYSFEGHRIRVSTDEHGYAWFAATDVAGALGQLTIGRALASLREEVQCLYFQKGPGSEGCTLALISEGGLLRLLLLGDSQTAWRPRRWLTHELLPALRPTGQSKGPPIWLGWGKDQDRGCGAAACRGDHRAHRRRVLRCAPRCH